VQPQPQAQPQQEVAPKSELDQYIETRKAELTELKTGGTGREIPMTKSQQVRADVLSAEINNAEKLKAMTPEERQVLYREQLKSELNDIRNNPDSTPEQIAYAEAYVAKELAQVSTTQQIKADLNTAQANFNQATAIMQQDLNYLKGVHMDTRSRAFGDMISAIGNVGQSCVSSITEMLRAEATEMGATQQESQEMLDQAKDLFNQCQSLIDSVLQLMDGVLQAEVQSMRDAIQA
jgi:flagellar biosynthesis/type III secretory pathway chaperone